MRKGGKESTEGKHGGKERSEKERNGKMTKENDCRELQDKEEGITCSGLERKERKGN